MGKGSWWADGYRWALYLERNPFGWAVGNLIEEMAGIWMGCKPNGISANSLMGK